jgi:2-oxo-3-hexenedioate decarboxylase/2-keto-4-pentenoate hydratase
MARGPSPATIADYLLKVRKAKCTVAWWPKDMTPRDERTGYRAQALLAKALARSEGEVAGYKIGLTAPQIWEQTGLKSPVYGVIRRKRIYNRSVTLRARDWVRLGLELEIILTAGEDIPRPRRKPYDKASVAPYIGSARAGFELIEDRGADYSRLSAMALIVDVGWNGGSLLAPVVKGWRDLDLTKLKGTVTFNGETVGKGISGDVMGHCYNSLAWLANKLGEHGQQVKKGMIVSTGSMVACQFIPPGTRAVGRIEGLGEIAVDYRI